MNTSPLLTAQINEKVKQYWLVQSILICFAGVATIVVLPIVIPIVMFAAGKYLQTLSVDLFERKLSVKKGIFVKVENTVPLEKITDVSMVQGPLMRMFGIYKLNFETAGQSGVGALLSVIGIVDAEQFRERVLSQKDAITIESKPEKAEEKREDPLLTSVRNIESLLTELVKSKGD